MPNQLGFSRALSGASLADIQATANKLYAATGASESQTGTVYNATASTITNGDPYQTALTKVANKFNPATGHMHTGAAGDGPVLAVVLDIAASGYSPVDGHLTFTPGPNMTITESGGDFTFTSAGGVAVDSLAVSGNTPLTGNVTFTAGSNVSIVQSGQNFEFSASGGGGSGGASIAFYANLPTGTITSTPSPITWTVIKDTNSAYSGATYTIPSTGYYFVSMQVDVVGTYTAGQYSNANVLVNGTSFLDMFQGDTGPGLGATSFSQSTLYYFTAGDLITTECQSTGTLPTFSTQPDTSLFSIFSVVGGGGSSSVISASYYLNTDLVVGGSGDFQIVNFTQNWDTNSAFSSNSFIAPEFGYYILSFQGLEGGGGGTNAIFGYQINGGSTNYYGANFGLSSVRGNGTTIIRLSMGDVLTFIFSTGGATTLSSALPTDTYFVIRN